MPPAALSSAIRALIEEAVEALSPVSIHLGGGPYRYEPVFGKTPEGNLTAGWQLRPGLAALVSQQYDQLVKLPANHALLDLLARDRVLAADLAVDAAGKTLLRPPLDASQSARMVFMFTTQHLLTRYFEQLSRVEINEPALSVVFEDLDRYLASPDVSFLYEAAVVGLEGDFERLDLGPDIWLRRRTSQDMSRVLQVPSLGQPIMEATAASHLFAGRARIPKHAPMDTTPAQRLVEDALTTLRLYRDQPLRLGMTVVRTEHWAPVYQQHSILYQLHVPSGKYEIDEDDIASVRTLLEQVRAAQLGNDRSWQLAARRFNLSYERTNPEDRLIDIWIALEALFLSDGRAELSYRGSLRAARFVGNTVNRRRDIFRLLRESYECRSAVVHGAAPQADFLALVDDSGRIAREALRLWIDPSVSHDMSSIDAGMLS